MTLSEPGLLLWGPLDEIDVPKCGPSSRLVIVKSTLTIPDKRSRRAVEHEPVLRHELDDVLRSATGKTDRHSPPDALVDHVQDGVSGLHAVGLLRIE